MLTTEHEEEPPEEDNLRKMKRNYARKLRKEVEENADAPQRRNLERINQIEKRLEEQGLLNTDLATLVSSVRDRVGIPPSVGVKGESKKETEAFIANIISIVNEEGVIEMEELKERLKEREWIINDKFFQRTMVELAKSQALQTWKGLVSSNILDTSLTDEILKLIKANHGSAKISELAQEINWPTSMLKKIVAFLCKKGKLVKEGETVYLPT